MGRPRDTRLMRIGRRRSLRYWQAAVDRVARMPSGALTTTAQQARHLRKLLDRLLAVADARLIPEPDRALTRGDWIWRPEAVRLPLTPPGQVGVPNDSLFGQGLKIFHDSAKSEVSLHQRPAPSGRRFDVVLEVYRFEGSFLSLVVDLPPEGTNALTSSHVIALSAVMQVERQLEMYARLNLRCGPNTETQVIEVQPDATGQILAEFDLAHLDLGPVEGAWIDLIMDAPHMNALRLSDIAIMRRPGAQF